MAWLGETIERGRSEEPVVFRFEHADGSRVVLEGRARNPMDDPRIEGIVAYTHDVTERQRLAEDRRRERDLRERIVETSPVGIAVVDGEAWSPS
jgi:PAS domain-containing protein